MTSLVAKSNKMSDDIAKVDDTAKRTIWGRLIAFFFGIVFIVLVAEVVLRFVAAFLGDQFRSIGQNDPLSTIR